jgi:hypothetical protein
MDLTDMRELFRDRRVWSALGVVIAPDGGPHWAVVPSDTGGAFDIVVEVEIQPSQVHVTARLRAGMWEVPAVGEEVAVLVPDGRIDFQPIVIAILSSGSVPTVQGPQPGRIVIVSPEVMIHDGTGGAVALARKSDVQALADFIETEAVFVLAGYGNTTPGTLPGNVPPVPDGTTVLKAK